jgi:hypothetical protein
LRWVLDFWKIYGPLELKMLERKYISIWKSKDKNSLSGELGLARGYGPIERLITEWEAGAWNGPWLRMSGVILLLLPTCLHGVALTAPVVSGFLFAQTVGTWRW